MLEYPGRSGKWPRIGSSEGGAQCREPVKKARTKEKRAEAGGHIVSQEVGVEAEGTAREGGVEGRSKDTQGIARET